MPLYRYTNSDGQTIEVFSSIAKRKAWVRRDGKTYFRDIVAERQNMRSQPGAWPLVSSFAGVHPSQIDGVRQECASKGIDVDFAPNGDVIWRNRANRRDYLRCMGLFDKDAGYGDPAPLGKHRDSA